jgi:hypothetical protein
MAVNPSHDRLQLQPLERWQSRKLDHAVIVTILAGSVGSVGGQAATL